MWAGMRPLLKALVSLSVACEGASTENPASNGRVLAGEPCFFIFMLGTASLPEALASGR